MDALATSLPCCRCVRCKIRIECEPIYFWMRVQLCMCSSIVLYIGRLSLVLNSARSGVKSECTSRSVKHRVAFLVQKWILYVCLALCMLQ